MAIDTLDKLFEKAGKIDVENYSKAQAGLRGETFKVLDTLMKEKKGKKILRSACVWHVLKQAVIQKFVKTNTSLSADELYNRISQYTGKWASARKLKVVGEAGSIEYQF